MDFRDFLGEAKKASFSNIFDKPKNKPVDWVAEIVFKSFVDNNTASEILNSSGVNMEPSFSKASDGSLIAYFEEASKIKPSEIKSLKSEPFVISARRFKV